MQKYLHQGMRPDRDQGSDTVRTIVQAWFHFRPSPNRHVDPQQLMNPFPKPRNGSCVNKL